MNKRIIVAMAALLLSLFANICIQAQESSLPQSGTCGDNITWTMSDDGVLTLTGTGAMTNYDTSNHQGPWRWRMDIKKVVVEDGITTIGDYAFFSDSPINEVELPATVETIGTGAFEDLKCTEIQLPASLTTIKERAFEGSSLTSITIPDKVTRIEDYAFSNCNLSSFHIPTSVTHLGKFLLASGNFNLTSITVDEGNTVYDSRDNCNAIIETSTNTLVEGCKTTVIPSTVTAIGDYAFWGRNEMTKYVIPATVKSVGNEVFNGYKDGFDKEIIFEGTTPPDFAEKTFSGLHSEHYIVRVPNAAVEAYRPNLSISPYDNFRAMSVRTHAIYDNNGETVKIYYDDKAAVPYNWYGCEITKDNFVINDEIALDINNKIGTSFPRWKIVTIEFDESMKDYRRTSYNNMFESLTKLKSIKGLDNLNTEGVTEMSYMFRYCSSLETLDLSSFDTKNVKYMYAMFMGCTGLKKIYVSDAFTTEKVKTTIPNSPIFYENKNLKYKEGNTEYANYIDGNFEKKVGTIGGEPFGATGNNLTVDNLDLTDGSDFVLTETAPVTATNVNYSRAMTSKWGTLCLPYPIDPQEASNNCQYYSIKNITDDAITLEPATSTIEAGTPVIFKRTDDADAATVNGKGLLLAKAKTNGNLVGTFTALTAPDDAYFIAKDAFRSVSDYKTLSNAVQVKAFRAYILPTKGQTLNASTLRINTGDATAIDNAMFDAIDNGTAEYYDASGKRTDGLHKGLNIVKANGKTKKIIVK